MNPDVDLPTDQYAKLIIMIDRLRVAGIEPDRVFLEPPTTPSGAFMYGPPTTCFGIPVTWVAGIPGPALSVPVS